MTNSSEHASHPKWSKLVERYHKRYKTCCYVCESEKGIELYPKVADLFSKENFRLAMIYPLCPDCFSQAGGDDLSPSDRWTRAKAMKNDFKEARRVERAFASDSLVIRQATDEELAELDRQIQEKRLHADVPNPRETHRIMSVRELHESAALRESVR